MNNESVWPFNGYAPGNYLNNCSVCKKDMKNVDKLCFVCLECAIRRSMSSSAPPVQEDVKEVELTIDACIDWLKELYEKIQHPDPDYESVDEVMVLDTIEILKKVRNKRLPSNIVELLKEANPWKEDVASASFRGGYNRCVSELRELLSSQPLQGNAEDQDDDDELEDKIVNIMCESIEQDSDYSLRGTEEAARKIIKLFKNK